MTPLEAATHADPYDYYARLRGVDALVFDTELGMWIASCANCVEAVLAHPDCRVRPLHEPVPSAIAQGATGQVFARLMRMNEGSAHGCPRAVIGPALGAVPTPHIVGLVNQLEGGVESLDDWMFTLPVAAIARLLGVPDEQLKRVADLTRDFVACLSPLSNAAQLHGADAGATQLAQVFSDVLEQTTLLTSIRSGDWVDAQVLDANLIGLLSQTCEATAGLIGNTLVTLVQRPDLLAQLQRTSTLATALVEEVARYDSPVQNTRRFVAKRCVIGNTVLEARDTVLVLLASANRDPVANLDPDRFVLDRPHRQLFSFGAGKHRCPGQTLALTLASQALAGLLRRPSVWANARHHGYWPSLNGRIPRFTAAVLGQ